MAAEIRIVDLGLIEYLKALEIQKELFKEVKNRSLRSALIFCRHYPVITVGRSAKELNLKAAPEDLSGRGIPVLRSERGGDVTYHGPGQLVVYPIIALNDFKKDIRFFLRRLENTVISVLSEFGIEASLKDGLTGVWVGSRKICSIGITVRNWVSYHGLALNVRKNDLENFALIRPCGMDIEMISMETILKKELEFCEIQETFIKEFKYV
jgi:lipoyl(octanoyl) transferase